MGLEIQGQEYLEVDVKEVRSATSISEAFSMILVDKNNKNNYLPIIIGFSEARAIKCELDGIEPLRPLTHSLFAAVFESDIMPKYYEIGYVLIESFKDGIYYASIDVITPSGQIYGIDARPSDAVAIALRVQCPIYVNKVLFDENFLKSRLNYLNQNEDEMDFSDAEDKNLRDFFDIDNDTALEEEEYDQQQLELKSVSFLEEELDNAVKKENFEYAALLQKIINEKKKQ